MENCSYGRLFRFLALHPYLPFFLFYIIAPIALKKSVNHHLVSIAFIMGLLTFFLIAKYRVYKVLTKTLNFFVDASCMFLGLATLYFIEYILYRNTNTVNIILYLFISMTYVPIIIRSNEFKKKLNK